MLVLRTSCVFKMAFCSSTPDSSELVTKPLQKPDNNLLMRIRCIRAGSHRKHAEQGREIPYSNESGTLSDVNSQT